MKRTLLFLCAGVVSTSFATAELVAHWPLDTDASDATGNGHDGMVVDGTVTFGEPGASGATGTSAAFPDNGRIDVPFDEALNPDGDFTVALWANAASTGGFASPITSRDDVGGGVSTHGYIIYNDNGGNWNFWTGDGNPGWDTLNGGPVTVNTWEHLAITYDSTTMTKTIWVNGAAVASDTAPDQYSPNGTVEMENLHIGAGQDNGLNFYFDGLIDDVGVWDEALDEAAIQEIIANGIGSGGADPDLRARSFFEFTYDGANGTFAIPISNAGETQVLNVTGATFSGDAAANFSVGALPGPVDPDGAGDLEIAFDPMGTAGVFEAAVEIASNDPTEPSKVVNLRVIYRNPEVSGPATVEFGSLPSGSGPTSLMVTIENLGSDTLTISDITLEGASAGNFAVGAFSNIAGGGSVEVELTFSSNGQEGSFLADLVIASDDPIEPALRIPIVARVEFSSILIAHWPLDEDASDASGNGFDGMVVGGTVNFGQAGANAATGMSASFPDNGHIDVPFDEALNPGVQGASGSESFTIALWANSSSNAGFNSPFTSREDNGLNVNGPIIYNTPDGNWSYWAGNGGPPGAWNALNGPAVPVNTWQHVAVTYESETETRKMFVDGVEVLSENLGVSANTQRDTHIGAGQDDGNNFYWNGLIDDVGLFRVALTEEDILQVMEQGVASFNKGSQFPFSVEETGGDMLLLRWDSQAGKLYNLRSVVDPSSAEPGEWPILDPHGGIVSTPPENTLTIPRPADASRYFVIEEFDAPPVVAFSDDLEGDVSGWTTVVKDANGNTEWVHGTPTGGSQTTGPDSGAGGSTNAWSTNLGDYAGDANVCLRSPEIDLSGVAEATLRFDGWRDGDGDTAEVRFLLASDQTLLGDAVAIDMVAFDTDWTAQTIPVPAAAIGETIVIEWNFSSDAGDDGFTGLSIDNIVVSD